MTQETVEIVIAVTAGLCTIIGALIAFIMAGILHSMKEMSSNISLLNTKMAVILSQVETHEQRINRLEDLKQTEREEG